MGGLVGVLSGPRGGVRLVRDPLTPEQGMPRTVKEMVEEVARELGTRLSEAG